MKEMDKTRIYAKRSVESVMNELRILFRVKSEFIVNVNFAFQDKERLYLVMDLMKGGDLRKHHRKIRMFTEEQTRFFLACVMEGLEEVHDKGILHRDIKPENLVFDEEGYLRITDFGIARSWSPDNGVNNSGTPGYMAPEVMERQNHSIPADYFALGVIGYECMMGRRPYLGKDKKEIYKAI